MSRTKRFGKKIERPPTPIPSSSLCSSPSNWVSDDEETLAGTDSPLPPSTKFTTYVDPCSVGKVIGKKRANLERMENAYNVNMSSVIDGEKARFNKRTTTDSRVKSSGVVVSGKIDDCERAFEEVHQWAKPVVVEFPIDSKRVGLVLGRQGRQVDSLVKQFAVRIQALPKRKGHRETVLQLNGPLKCCFAAIRAIATLIQEAEKQETVEHKPEVAAEVETHDSLLVEQ